MGKQICMGAMMTCTMGAAPASLIVAPTNKVMAGKMPAANIMDNKPFANIPTFGTCRSPANPAVAAATAANKGVLTQMPCVPVIPAPWIPGVPQVMIGKMPALNDTCKVMCQWAGMISFTTPGQFTVND
ncbi:MAG: DUF4280 domain-containing protein [Bernardetiaceae bacterium]|nr:DUF4280 domain-containing protein [Bernardetiaceae bacterium]